MTAASAAAVEAAQKELGCERVVYPSHPYSIPGDNFCRRHHLDKPHEWTDRGCPVAVRVADAVVEAQG